jgi:hypothetical protein
MSADNLLAKLQADERSVSRQRTRLQDRIDFIRSGGGGSASASQVEEQLRALLAKERGLSERRAALHSQIAELQPPAR